MGLFNNRQTASAAKTESLQQTIYRIDGATMDEKKVMANEVGAMRPEVGAIVTGFFVELVELLKGGNQDPPTRR